ncbi:MAG: ferritin-like domain-containing protein [Solirubrobacterales bacterium]
MDNSSAEQLVKYLADAHAVEEQALAQLRAAPGIVGEERLAAAFEQHLRETEGHERGVRARLEAHGADASTLKDLAGKAGGWGMVLFARSQPDTPGKLTAHAFAYESMEYATYELLRLAAEAAGDGDTAGVAASIAVEESRMAERLADLFDAAVEASLRDLDPEQVDRHLDHYLEDAHALEQQATQMLEAAPKLIDDEELTETFRAHLEETRGHKQRVEERLEARGASPSRLKDLALRTGALNLGAFFGAQPDTAPKLAGFAYAFENLELAGYELLRRVAERAGDGETAAMAEAIAGEEREAAAGVAAGWERTMRAAMAGS